MRWIVLSGALCLAAGPVLASECHMRSAFVGRDLVKIGDSARKAFELEPDREWQLETAQGGASGLRLDFYEHDKTIEVYIRGGKVTRICRRLD
jgi:hypothetical protein